MQTANFHLIEFLCRHCGKGEDIVKPELLTALQKLRDLWGKPMRLTCGYRCPQHNAEVGGAKHSAHMTGQAADVEDPDGTLKAFCTETVLEEVGLWRETDKDSPTWCHLQTRPAGTRIFGR